MARMSLKDSATVRIARRSDRCTVLGPGVRAVVWVQGCPLRCPGCVSPQWLAFDGGEEMAVDDLALWLLGLDGIEGVTFSGGEPMAQAGALTALIDAVRAEKPGLTFMSYSGFTLERLRAAATPGSEVLLQRLDILVDGPYLEARHTDLRWRGSDNQRVHLLSDRYRGVEPRLQDRGVWLETELRGEAVGWMGIPPRGLRRAVEQRAVELGLDLVQEETKP